MRRELAIALNARVTWLIAAAAALLVGHGFVLAVDIYSASSRSALASALQSREMDPLAGIVRPTLGGLELAVALLAPVIAARSIAIEKERGTYGALCLAVGSSGVVIARKALASFVACALLTVTPVALFAAFQLVGGHVDLVETSVALSGEVLHIVLVVSLATAAAALSRTLAQAVTLGILASLSSWAIDAADGFAALAWLGGAAQWSIDQRLAPFQRGIVSVGSVAWLALASVIGFAIALVGGTFAPALRKATMLVGAVVLGGVALAATSSIRRGFDWTEQRRASLPPAAVEGLRALPLPIAIDVYLDRDDSRRRQIESDVLAKLVLARSDILVRAPLDDQADAIQGRHDEEYGRIVLHVGDATRETRSTSRREIVSLLFDAAGRTLPDWSQPSYPGFPAVITGKQRWLLGGFAYTVLPLAFVAVGLVLTRRRTTR